MKQQKTQEFKKRAFLFTKTTPAILKQTLIFFYSGRAVRPKGPKPIPGGGLASPRNVDPVWKLKVYDSVFNMLSDD